jgi:DNA polymerase
MNLIWARTTILTSKLSLDFETRSKIDLKKAGTWRYSIDPSTDILCLSYRSDEVEGLWYPAIFPLLTPDLDSQLQRVLKGNLTLEAHNAFFEICIWNNVAVKKYGFPKLDYNLWTCSAAKAAAIAMPRRLEHLAPALKVETEKDMQGHRLMLKMSKPRKPTKDDDSEWHEHPADLIRLGQYCERDTLTEEKCSERMPELRGREIDVFYHDMQINLRGFYCDMELVDNALDFINKYSYDLNNELADITDGQVKTSGQRDKILTFLKDHGVDLPNLQSKTVEEASEKNYPYPAGRVIEIRKALGGTSVKKLEAFKRMADCNDNRIRGTMLYHGASTGRVSGKGIQPHNFPRGTIKDVDACIDYLRVGNYGLFKSVYPDVVGSISSCLRGMISAPPGKELIAADFAAIESRVLFWLADCQAGLKVYRTHGKAYEDMAAFLYNCSINEIKNPSQERQLGKQAILGCGYGMGHKKFKITCHGYGMNWVDDKLSQKAVQGFRERYHEIPKFWRDLNFAAIMAVVNPGKTYKVGRVAYKKIGSILYCRLPNDRRLSYPYPRIIIEDTEWGPREQLTYMGINSQTRKWERQRNYGGKLAEQCTQAVARDFMVEAMLRLEKKGYPVILTVHDEIVCEVDKGFGSVEEFEKIMEKIPFWGVYCPIKAEGWRGPRFKK